MQGMPGWMKWTISLLVGVGHYFGRVSLGELAAYRLFRDELFRADHRGAAAERQGR